MVEIHGKMERQFRSKHIKEVEIEEKRTGPRKDRQETTNIFVGFFVKETTIPQIPDQLGWLNESSKVNSDSFRLFTYQYCITRKGRKM